MRAKHGGHVECHQAGLRVELMRLGEGPRAARLRVAGELDRRLLFARSGSAVIIKLAILVTPVILMA